MLPRQHFFLSEKIWSHTELNMTVAGHLINPSREENFLGVNIDSRLKFNSYYSKFIERYCARTRILSVIYRGKYGSEENFLLKTRMALVKPILKHASAA